MNLDEAKQMLADGDIKQSDLDEHTRAFLSLYKRLPRLNDDQFLLCVANFDDDYRGDDAANLILEYEASVES